MVSKGKVAKAKFEKLAPAGESNYGDALVCGPGQGYFHLSNLLVY